MPYQRLGFFGGHKNKGKNGLWQPGYLALKNPEVKGHLKALENLSQEVKFKIARESRESAHRDYLSDLDEILHLFTHMKSAGRPDIDICDPYCY